LLFKSLGCGSLSVICCGDTVQAPEWHNLGVFCYNPVPVIPTQCDKSNIILGFRILINNAFHYGWFRLAATSNPLTATLIEYAWNDEPDAVILACQTSHATSVFNTSIEKPLEVKVMPNPFNNNLQVTSTINEPYQIGIYDMVGNLVYNSELLRRDNVRLNPSLSTGMYFLQIKGKTFVKELTIIKN